MTQRPRSPGPDYQPDYFLGNTLPEPGSTLQVAPGVYWLRMSMPMALDHINLWLLEDGDAWTVVDTGLNIDATREAWERVFETQLQGRPVRRVICTHMHPDHVGLADWLCRRWGATLWMTQGEYLSARMVSAGMEPTGTEGLVEHFRVHGAAPEHLQALSARGNFYMRMVPTLPGSFQRIDDGQRLRIGHADWQVIVGGGHSPEHASLWCAEQRLLISGDLLLPRISTNVSVYPIDPEADALGRYLHSLERFDALDAGTRVLPSHGLP
ncbi:MAG: MBL fold metallo-hydrolase, partial [Betaproteobacteria bacterium]|nr:MBL fold metallo-hydrolase [Betaproteobacteria bacterium]